MACGGDDDALTDAGTDTGADTGMDASEDAPPGDPSFVASCVYENPFSMEQDCKEYRGPGWSMASAEADCGDVFLGAAGTFAVGECDLPSEVGRCTVGEPGTAEGYVLVNSGDPGSCGAAGSACEGFLGGTFVAAPECSSCEPSETEGQPFIPWFQDCREPLDDTPGLSADGQVCTPTIISGSTEPGRHFADYADCDVVRAQRPYYAAPSTVEMDPEDPRLDDEEYMAELEWLTSQAESSACVCCHSASRTPEGPAVWDTEAGPLWIDTVSDEALAMLGGYTDSAAFGFLPADESNGFDRSTTGLPTTDRDRMLAFFDRELERRGLSREDAEAQPPFAPFFRELIEFEPEACPEGIGMDEDGSIRWTGGGARYVHILEPGSQAPGVQPNWDMPEGTLWHIRMDPEAQAMGCGMSYGELPENAIQVIPEEGDAPALVSGQQYFLYVQRDIAQPIARCLFTAP